MDELENENLDSGDESFQGSTTSTTSPIYSSRIWMLSVRPVRRLTRFSSLSLLFQPDTRLFCPHGSSCQMNEEHQSMYSHDLPVFDSIVTQFNPEGVPGVLRTWSLSPNSYFEDENTLPRELRNQQVIVYVHGHRTRFLKATATLSHLNLRFPDHTILGFLWPSHSRKESYLLARSKASSQAATRFRVLLIALQKLGNTVHVVAHSMGARVALHALSPRVISPRKQLADLIDDSNESILEPIQTLIMVGAAIPSNAFLSSSIDPDNSWNHQTLLAKQIINMYSAQDEVLSSAYKWAEAFAQFSILTLFHKDTKAMGSVGITTDVFIEGDVSHHKLYDIDVSSEVPTHSVHAYLASPTFQEILHRQLNL